jgi:hypothetical protein
MGTLNQLIAQVGLNIVSSPHVLDICLFHVREHIRIDSGSDLTDLITNVKLGF